ncbi:hypothetical protein LZ30DRAFT_115570 [Colletotrichum cereale]|nr:hypothetical protein LZ30DRAFT_115570 [Colletotrichum cereale]
MTPSAGGKGGKPCIFTRSPRRPSRETAEREVDDFGCGQGAPLLCCPPTAQDVTWLYKDREFAAPSSLSFPWRSLGARDQRHCGGASTCCPSATRVNVAERQEPRGGGRLLEWSCLGPLRLCFSNHAYMSCFSLSLSLSLSLLPPSRTTPPLADVRNETRWRDKVHSHPAHRQGDNMRRDNPISGKGLSFLSFLFAPVCEARER